MLSWLRGGEDVNLLIARKNYPKAIRRLERQLADDPGSVPLRQLLGDVLGRAGENQRAVEVLRPLVDRFAADGFVAKAIAVLKKIQRLDPGQTDVEDRLASLVNQGESEAPGIVPLPPTPPAGPEEEAPWEGTARAGETPPFVTSEIVADWFDEAVEERTDFYWSPLFNDFSKSELAAVIGGLRLLVKKPGAIIFGQNEPGSSFFILASGLVRVYRRNAANRYEQIDVLHDGEFFGESSVLFGRARTATVTAATECELLELDKETFDTIAAKHPRVRELLELFHHNRAGSDVEATIDVTGDDLTEPLEPETAF